MTNMIADEIGRIPMSPFLAATLSRAAAYADAQGHLQVTIEHLLLALAEDPEATVVLKSSSIDIARLTADVSAQLGRIEERTSGGQRDVVISTDLKRILEAAAAAASQGRRREINGAIVLAAIVGEGRSTSAHLLRAQGLTFEAAIRALQKSQTAAPPAAANVAPPNPAPASADQILAGARERVQTRTALAGAQAQQPAAPPISNGAGGGPAYKPSPEPPFGSPPAGAGPTASTMAPARAEAAPRQAAPQPQLPDPAPAPSYEPRWEPVPVEQPPAAEPPLYYAKDEVTAPPRPMQAQPIQERAPPQSQQPMQRAPAPSAPLPVSIPVAQPMATPAPPAPQPPPQQWAPPPMPQPVAAAPRAPARMPPPLPPPLPSAAPGMPYGSGPPPAGPPFFGAPLQGPGPQGGQPPPGYRPAPPQPAPPWPEAGDPRTAGRRPEGVGAAADPPRDLTFDPRMRPQQRPPPPPQPQAPLVDPRRRMQAPVVQAGQLIENIPRRMRVAIPVIVEARIARAEVKAIADTMQGGGAIHRHEVMVTKAMTVRLRAPDGGFAIETASPETQWIDNVLGVMSDDYASWRWTVTPKARGKRRLQLVVAARTTGGDGLMAETALPDQVIEVKVGINYARTAAKWGGWITAASAGGILARFGEDAYVLGREFVARVMGG